MFAHSGLPGTGQAAYVSSTSRFILRWTPRATAIALAHTPRSRRTWECRIKRTPPQLAVARLHRRCITRALPSRLNRAARTPQRGGSSPRAHSCNAGRLPRRRRACHQQARVMCDSTHPRRRAATAKQPPALQPAPCLQLCPAPHQYGCHVQHSAAYRTVTQIHVTRRPLSSP